MFHKIISCLVMLLLAALLNLFPNRTAAQEITVNRIYDFSGNTDTLNSQINFVYADSNRIFALGEAHHKNEAPHAFVAAFDYSGSLIWQKPILLPNGLISLSDGFDNLKKVKSNVYVALGNIPNVPKMNGTLSFEPFLYFFTATGDSIKLLRFPSDSIMLQKMTALTVDDSGEIVAGGVTSLLGADSNSIYPRNYWFVRVNDAGNLVTNSIFPLVNQVYLGEPDPVITKILPVAWDSIKYVVAANTYAALRGGILIDIDTQLNIKSFTHFSHGIPPQCNLVSSPIIGSGIGPYELNLICQKENNHSIYWSMPALVREGINIATGIYYAMAHYSPVGIFDGYQLQWDRAVVYDTANLPSYTGFPAVAQGRSSLAEAINGDMLLQKEAARPSDTLNPHTAHSGYFLPAMLRVDSNGNTRWGRTFQHVQTVDSGLYHSFNDVSVAPDGRIVMGGYLRSRYPVPGYDTVGTVSWLVILNDTLHDHQPPSEGVRLSAIGKGINIAVYPNPTLDFTTVAIQNFQGNLNDLSLQFCDITGCVLQNRKCKSTKEIISLNNYAPGVYFIKVLYRGKPAGMVKIVKY